MIICLFALRAENYFDVKVPKFAAVASSPQIGYKKSQK